MRTHTHPLQLPIRHFRLPRVISEASHRRGTSTSSLLHESWGQNPLCKSTLRLWGTLPVAARGGHGGPPSSAFSPTAPTAVALGQTGDGPGGLSLHPVAPGVSPPRRGPLPSLHLGSSPHCPPPGLVFPLSTLPPSPDCSHLSGTCTLGQMEPHSMAQPARRHIHSPCPSREASSSAPAQTGRPRMRPGPHGSNAELWLWTHKQSFSWATHTQPLLASPHIHFQPAAPA